MPEAKLIKNFKQGQRTVKRGTPDEYKQSGYWLALTDPATGVEERAAFLLPKYNSEAIEVCTQAGVGSQVLVTYKENNGYKNIAKIEFGPSDPTQPKSQPKQGQPNIPAPQAPVVPEKNPAEIALKYAIKTVGMYLNAPERYKNMYKVTKVTPDILTEEIKTLAEMYLQFLGGESQTPVVVSDMGDLKIPETEPEEEEEEQPEDDIPF